METAASALGRHMRPAAGDPMVYAPPLSSVFLPQLCVPVRRRRAYELLAAAPADRYSLRRALKPDVGSTALLPPERKLTPGVLPNYCFNFH